MAQTYKFTISMPVSSALARDRVSNSVHLEHTVGGLLDTDLEGMCQDIAAMYQTRYGNASHEINVKAYDVDLPPNYPRADVTVNSGSIWPNNHPREVALCLSFYGHQRGNRRQRGRIYLMPGLQVTITIDFERPNDPILQWALDFYSAPNASFPDLGGVDWKFGVWSKADQKFTQSQNAWVNDEWDTQRRRGLRETKRFTAVREGQQLASVYSRRFAIRSGAAGSTTYTVPAGKRAVVRSLDGWCVGAIPASIAVAVAGIHVYNLPFPAAGAATHWESRQVAYAGEAIVLSTSGPDVRAALSGYLFDDPGGLLKQELERETVEGPPFDPSLPEAA